MNIANQAKQQKIALAAIKNDIDEFLAYFQGPKFYVDTSVQTHEIISRLRGLKERVENGLEGVTIPTADDYDSGKDLSEFHRGERVNVRARSTDEFSDFSGIVTDRDWAHNELTVKDEITQQTWICKPSQCSFSSDEVMHGD